MELRTDDLEGHYQLAIWCKEKKLPTQADREFETVLKINPDHEDARKELGYVVKYEGKWMTEDEAKIAQGYVKYKGMWFKKEDYEVRKKNDEEDERIKKAYSEFQKEANKLGARNSKTRAEAYEKATAIADKNNLQDVKPWLADAKAYSDKYWDTITEMEGRNAVLEVRAFLTTVRKMESFQTRIGGVLGGAGPAPTVTIQQPTMDTVIFKGTVLMPLGGGSGLKRNE